MIPCLTNESLKLLVGTADERYQTSPDYFIKTHYPQILHRYYQNQLIQEVTELELLEELSEDEKNGNRVFIVFGSTGSGKSELLCWLKHQWKQTNPSRPVIRISRSELNPQVLIRKCYETLGLEMMVDESRWDLLLRKPVTIINQIIWSTLAEFFDSDEKIIPLALLLRPVIEENVLEFCKQIDKGNIVQPLEVLSANQFLALKESTTLSVGIEHTILRQSLIQKLDYFLFNGMDISTLLKNLSKDIKQNNVRPLLLIDDLVQSINLYATDLLDHLLNLEEGSWDVVIGVTPGVLQDNGLGRELVQRIKNLDTIDDRVKKLWLSDETGKSFYSLGEENVVPYMQKYLMELKKTQGFDCNKRCVYFSKCSNKLNNDHDIVQLLPFNQFLIKRIYMGIPTGKGKLRYLILNSKEIMKYFLKGKIKSVKSINAILERDCYVEHDDVVIKLLAESYSDPGLDQVRLSGKLLEYFGYKDEDIKIKVRSLIPQSESETLRIEHDHDEEDKFRPIRDWIEGKKINTELLSTVKKGVATLINDVTRPAFISRSFTSRTAALQRTEVQNGLKYPISFVKNKTIRKEIVVEPNITAFDIAGFQELKPANRRKKFQHISDEIIISEWIYLSEQIQTEWEQEIQSELGRTLIDFAFQLKKWIEQKVGITTVPWLKDIGSPFSQHILYKAEQLFLDWYLLRENIIDASLMAEQSVDHGFEEWIEGYKCSKILDAYDLGNGTLGDFIKAIQYESISFKNKLKLRLQEKAEQLESLLPFVTFNYPEWAEPLNICINNIRSNHVDDLKDVINELTRFEEWYVSEKVFDKRKIIDEKRKKLEEMYNSCLYQMNETNYLITTLINNSEFVQLTHLEVPWDSTEMDKLYWKIGSTIDLVKTFYNTLSSIPPVQLKYILEGSSDLEPLCNFIHIWAEILNTWRVICRFEAYNKEKFIGLLKQLGNIDIYQLYKLKIEDQKREQYIRYAIEIIKQDRGLEIPNSTAEGMVKTLENDHSLRPMMRKQISNLLVNGKTVLPPTRWRNLISDIEREFPSLYSRLRVQLIMETHNE